MRTIRVNARIIHVSILFFLCLLTAYPASALSLAERDRQIAILEKMVAEWSKARDQWQGELALREKRINDLREKIDEAAKVKEIQDTAKDLAEGARSGVSDALEGKKWEEIKAAIEVAIDYMKMENQKFEFIDMVLYEKQYLEKIANQKGQIKSLEAAIALSNQIISASQKEIATLNATPVIRDAPKWLANLIQAGQAAQKRVADRKAEEARIKEEEEKKNHPANPRRPDVTIGGGGVDRPRPAPEPVRPPPAPERPRPEPVRPPPAPERPRPEPIHPPEPIVIGPKG